MNGVFCMFTAAGCKMENVELCCTNCMQAVKQHMYIERCYYISGRSLRLVNLYSFRRRWCFVIAVETALSLEVELCDLSLIVLQDIGGNSSASSLQCTQWNCRSHRWLNVCSVSLSLLRLSLYHSQLFGIALETSVVRE